VQDNAGSGAMPSGGGAAVGGGTQGTGGNIVGVGGSAVATGGSGPVGGSGSGGSSGSGEGCALQPDGTGWVAADTNSCAVQGAWYYYDDCSTSPTDCTAHTAPAPDAEGFPNTGGAMCTTGVIAPVNDSTEYSTKWGAGIALNLNQPVDSEDKNPIGTLPVALRGFSFTLSGNQVPSEIRVTFPTAATSETAHFKTIATGAGSYQVLFSDAAQGSWVVDAVALDSTQVNAIQFQVPSKLSVEVPFDFCVEQLAALL